MCVFLTENSEEEKESGDESTDVTQKVEPTEEDTTVISIVAALTTEVEYDYGNNTFGNEKNTQLELILMVLVPLVFLALLLISVVLIAINCKREKAKQGKYFVCFQSQTIAPWVNGQTLKQNTFCFYTELPSSQGSQSVLQTCEYYPNICLELGIGSEKELRGFKLSKKDYIKLEPWCMKFVHWGVKGEGVPSAWPALSCSPGLLGGCVTAGP